MCECLKISKSENKIRKIYSKLAPPDMISLCQLNGQAVRGVYPILGNKPRYLFGDFCSDNNPKRIRLYLEANEILVLPKHIILTTHKDYTIYIGPDYTRMKKRVLQRHGIVQHEKKFCYVLSMDKNTENETQSGNNTQSNNNTRSGNSTQSVNNTQSGNSTHSGNSTQSTNVTQSANVNQSVNGTQSTNGTQMVDGTQSDNDNQHSDNEGQFSDDNNHPTSHDGNQSGHEDNQSDHEDNQSDHEDNQSDDDGNQSDHENNQYNQSDDDGNQSDHEDNQYNQSDDDSNQSDHEDNQSEHEDNQSHHEDNQSDDDISDNDQSTSSSDSTKTEPKYSMRYRNLCLIPEKGSNEQIQNLIHCTKDQFLKFVNILKGVTKQKRLDVLSVSSRAFLFRIKVINMLY